MYIVGTARWNNYPTIDITRRGGRKKERERRVRKDEEEICRQTFFEIALNHPAPLSNNNVVNRRLKFKRKKERKRNRTIELLDRRNKIILNRVITPLLY